MTALTAVAYIYILKFQIFNCLNKIEIFINMGTYRSESFKNTSAPKVLILFRPNFILDVSVLTAEVSSLKLKKD